MKRYEYFDHERGMVPTKGGNWVDGDEAEAKIDKLERTIKMVIKVMGPTRPKCCQGCHFEWDEALRILKGVDDGP